MKTVFAVLSTMLVMSLAICTNLSAQWTNGQNATHVIGQADFTSSGPGTTATTLRDSRDVAIDVANGKLYLSDTSNHRILRYSYPISANQPTAELVFGQSNMTSGSANAGGLSASSLNAPCGLSVDSTGRLWVADDLNHRVLWFNNAYSISSNKPSADGVLGQANFTSGSANRGGSVGQNTLNRPAGLLIDASGNLFVVDDKNNRVLRFDNATSKSNGANANGVLGQPNFTSNSSATTQSRMYLPYGVAMSGTTLFVSDRNNNRVLRFDNAASKSDGADADGVLGQANFTSGSANRGGSTAQNSLYLPMIMCCDDAGRLYVADNHNHRIVIFDTATGKGDGANADNVLGQSNFTSNSAATTQNGMYYPSGAAVDSTNNRLFAIDNTNNRALQFDAAPANRAPIASADVYSVDEDKTLTVLAPGVLGNDEDPDVDPLTASLQEPAAQGIVTLNPDGSFSYSPDLNFNGTDTFSYRANDGNADSEVTTVIITVLSVNDAPVADAGEDQLVEANASGGAYLVLDGSGSSDLDDVDLTFTWTGPFGNVEGVTPTVFLGLGENVVFLTVDDSKGGTTSDEVIIQIVDTTAPILDELAPDLSVLWPPNHKMVEVVLVGMAFDTVDLDLDIGVSVDILDADVIAQHEPDYEVKYATIADGVLIVGLSLRAERSDSGDGRTYLTTVEITDDSLNSASYTVQVTVPYDQGKKNGKK